MNTRTLSRILLFVAIGLTLVGLFVLATQPALAVKATAAVTVKSGLLIAGEEAYGTKKPTEIGVIVGKITRALITVTGVVFLILTLYGGIMYMTAAGDEEKVKKSKRLLGQSIIGLIIVLAAYSITVFVVDLLGSAI